MPDDSPGDSIGQQPINESSNVESINSPLPPNDPPGPAAEGISREEIQSEVKNIEDRVKRAEKWMIGLTGAIVISAFCSIGVGLLQWDAMKRQLNVMRLSLYADQRPWIKLDYGDGPALQLAPSLPIIQKVTLTNIGKSPLLKLRAHIGIELITNGTPPDFDWNRSHFESKVPILLPNSPSGVPAQLMERSGHNLPHILTKPEYDGLKNGTLVLVTFARIAYDDTLGGGHWQQFCSWVAVPGISELNQTVTQTKCAEYNDTEKHKAN